MNMISLSLYYFSMSSKKMAAVKVPLRWFSGIARIMIAHQRPTLLQRCASSGISHDNEEETLDGKASVTISDSCVARLRELGENTSLRIGVEGGGCSGFQYTFELNSPVEEGDLVFKRGSVSVIVDETSLEYIKGATIEYHTELIRSAFRIASNPLAEQGCSCGASFNLKVT